MIKLFLKLKLNYLTLALLIFGFLACSEEKKQEELIVIVDGQEITMDDFRLFYEFDPNFGIDSTGMDALHDELNKYIDYHLALVKAWDDDLWDEPVFIRGYNWEKRQAMLRQLYREVVEKSVEVTDEETLQEFMRLSIEVNIRHLYTKTEARIEELYRRLQAGESFEDLASEVFQDTVLSKNGGNLGWIKLADFEGNLIEAIEQLNVGETSKPVSSEWGFHIVELLNRKEEVIIVEEDYHRTKQKLYNRIEKKKSRLLSSKFISNYVGEINPQLSKLSFRQLVHVLVPPGEREKKEYTNKISLSDAMILAAEEDLSELADQDLIVYKGGSVSSREYLEAMKEIPLGHRPKFNSAKQLSNQIGIWVRDKLLFERAIELDLDENKNVQKEIYSFMAEQSYYNYLNEIMETMSIPHFVFNYFQISEESRFKAPNHPLSGFFNLETWRWWRAEINLRSELRRKKPSIWINEKLLEEENNQIEWNNRVRMFMVRKPS